MHDKEESSIGIEELHKIHIEMLKELVRFLNANNIQYFLDYGTLIGAVRHKGFIPWDDDIDISMTRPEYEKFMNVARENSNKIGEKLYITSLELENSIFPFCKVYNTEYGVQEEIINVESGEFLWIDIFPYDAISGNQKKDLKLFKQILFWRKLWVMRLGKYSVIYKCSKNFFKGIIKSILKIFIDIFPAIFYAKKIRKLAISNEYEKCNTVQNIIITKKLYKGVLKEKIEKTVLLQFEDDQYPAIESYDEHLKSIYGDYMQLPPIDKRETHLKKIWKIEDDSKSEK